jgi:hypothetical protein
MGIPNSRNDRDYRSYREDPSLPDETVRAIIEASPGWVSQAVDNEVVATYPSSAVVVYSYYAASVLKYEITVTYTNSSKTVFQSAKRTA